MSGTKQRARKTGKPQEAQKSSQKRKREGSDDVEEERRSKRVPSDIPDRPKSNQVDESIAMMDSTLLSDLFAKCMRRCLPNSSPLELEEQDVPTKAFMNTTTYEKPRTAANLPDFLEKFSGVGKEELSSCEGETMPHTLVVTSSGIRTADLTRELRAFNTKDCKVGKLIAKHMKLKKNIQFMKETKVNMAISTPMRMKDLIDADALKVEGVKRILIDGSYRDEKTRTIFEMDELFLPLVGLLNVEAVRQRYGAQDSIDILVF